MREINKISYKIIEKDLSKLKSLVNPDNYNGAEDFYYSNLETPYLTSNQYMQNISELSTRIYVRAVRAMLDHNPHVPDMQHVNHFVQ